MLRLQTPPRRFLPLAPLLLWSAVSAGAQEVEEQQARGFVESMAALVYNTAWPTATYQRSSITGVTRVPGGLDVVARLSGTSAFGGGSLWLDLAFEFRNGGFSDLSVRGHNAVFVPPFETMKTVGAMAYTLAAEFEESRDAPAAPRATEPRRQTGQVRVASVCPAPLKLWLRYPISEARWRVEGVWSLGPNDTTYLALGDERIHAAGSTVYLYAETQDRGLLWDGDIDVPFGERVLPMRELRLATNPNGSYRLPFSCPEHAAQLADPTRYIGALLQDVAFDEGEYGDLEGGMRIVGLQEGYPAQRRGFAVGDIIVGLDGDPASTAADFTERLNREPPGPRMIAVLRGSEGLVFETTPTVPLERSALDHARCLEAGNPPDYWLGAVARPSRDGGRYAVALHPATTGRLFDPSEISIQYRPEPLRVTFTYPREPSEAITHFEYNDRDRAVFAVTASGSRLDLGVRIECQVQPGLARATEVRMRRVEGDEEVEIRFVPLRQVD